MRTALRTAAHDPAPGRAHRAQPAAAARRRLRALACWLLACTAALLLAGCAGLPQRPAQPASQHRVAPDDAALSRLLAEAGVPAGRSGFRPLLLSGSALRARLALIERAELGIDIQTYLLGNDATGHQLMRALRDAAARGVRVRLLVDDLYTVGATDVLLGLAAHANVELRLYNPFPAGRDSVLLRAGGLLGDFQRLNRRMHNKLFVADGRIAIVGGRNLADAYFMRSDEGNFIDFDLLCGGAVAAELNGHFDRFWNSGFAVPIEALADNGLSAERRRASFDVLTRPATAPRPLPPAPAALYGVPLATPPDPLLPRPAWTLAEADVFFDSPDKTAGVLPPGDRLPVAGLLGGARSHVVVVSPYFLPSEAGLERIRQARERGVAVQVLTNSLRDSDEPLVSVAYGRRRLALLQSGVRLFELSSQRLRREPSLGRALGASIGRLHAKLGFIDDRTLLVGSMNLDPRSANTNTELALAVHSAALTREVLAMLVPERGLGAYEVRLRADGQSMEWVARDSDGDERLPEEPAPPWWQRLQLWLLSLLVPDDLL